MTAIVVAEEEFHHRNGIILKLWEWLNDEKQLLLSKFNYINKHLYLEKNSNHLKLRYPDPCNFFYQSCIGWANQARLWLLRTLTFRIIWIYQLIRQQLSFPLYKRHPTWFSLLNDLKFNE